MVKCVWVCVYAPVNEKGMKGKVKLEKFWEDLGQLLKNFENVRRVFLLGDMHARVGSTEIGGVVGKYGVEGEEEEEEEGAAVLVAVTKLAKNTFLWESINRW